MTSKHNIMMISLALRTVALALALANLPGGEARTVTVKNACSYTVWPALWTDPNASTNIPSQPGGWEAPTGSQISFTVPDNCTAGRIWGRRNCDFSNGTGGINTCLTGGCNGGLVCDKNTGVGLGPVTVAEFTLSSSGTADYYDVSLVDGFNLPLRIQPTYSGCSTVDCPVDLNPTCPSALKGPVDPTGATNGCKSACEADPNQANSKNCCTGDFNTPATCPPSGVQYYAFFKSSCPKSYVYPYDENPSPLLCPSSAKTDFVVTFCP